MDVIFQGRVNLRNPDHKFCLMEMADYGLNNGLPPIAQRRIFFGREVGGADRKLIPTYQLKSRTYLGPTAMDAEMAFLMANQSLATAGKLVYDPFVGTGSILVAAAHFGAMTMVIIFCFVYFKEKLIFVSVWTSLNVFQCSLHKLHLENLIHGCFQFP